MADNKSFDILSNVDMVEVKNALEQVNKEIEKRYDFKGSVSHVELQQKEHKLIILTEDEYKLHAVQDILNSKLITRKLPVKAFQFQSPESASNGHIRVTVNIQQGIPTDKAKEIVKFIKDLNLKKIQSSINQDIVRVVAPKIDDLQVIIEAIKNKDFGIHIEVGNYR